MCAGLFVGHKPTMQQTKQPAPAAHTAEEAQELATEEAQELATEEAQELATEEAAAYDGGEHTLS